MVRLRFAPSPTGFVHVGNARTALFNFLHAKRKEGKLVLRIEDTDVERSKREYEENLIRDMRWLGIEWDEGPDVGGPFAPYRQSERNDIYRKYAEQLIDNGQAYYCFCSAEELQKEKENASDKEGVIGYPGKCRNIPIEEAKRRVAAGEEAAIRLKIPKDTVIEFYDLVRDKVSFDSNLLSDPVILRSTGIPAYNYSVVIDDHLMEISTVIRGEDHISNTARQLVLYDALSFARPQFAHLSMVMGEDNTKLSKRHGSTSIFQFREEGYLPQALFNYLALLGWSPGGNTDVVLTKEQLVQSFNLKKVTKAAAVFDYQKLKWLNREHIRRLENKVLGQLMIPFLEREGFRWDKMDSAPAEEKEPVLEWIGKAAKVLSNYNYLLAEIARDFSQFYSWEVSSEVREELMGSDRSMKVLSVLFEEIKGIGMPVEFTKISEVAKKLQETEGIKGKEFYHPIRLALTGKESGIELKDFIPLIETGAVLGFNKVVMNMASRLENMFKS